MVGSTPVQAQLVTSLRQMPPLAFTILKIPKTILSHIFTIANKAWIERHSRRKNFYIFSRMLAFDLKLPALWQLLGEISGIGSCATPLNLKSALIGFASFCAANEVGSHQVWDLLRLKMFQKYLGLKTSHLKINLESVLTLQKYKWHCNHHMIIIFQT